MSEFESLVNKLLDQKPELTREELDEKIKEKKDKIGSGYLTDQGALFLIAADMEVPLAEPQQTNISLSDLYAGAKEVSLESRLLNISPTKKFSRKDGSSLSLRTMTVYDGKSSASVKLWDEKATEPQLDKLKPGDMIKIIKAYVKSDLNGNPTLNIGSGSTIEQSADSTNIPNIESITKDVSQVKEGERDLVVTGTLDGQIIPMEFTNSRGIPGKAIRFRLKGNEGNPLRVVLWGKDESSIPRVISNDAKVRLLGVKTRNGNQGLEIHGNDSTMIEIEGRNEIDPLIVRIISTTKSDTGNTMILGVDNQKKLFNILDSSKLTDSFEEGDTIECMPSKIQSFSVTLDADSFVRKIDNDESIPTLKEMRTKISDVKIDNDYCIEAIILKIPERREVQTKSGDSISLSEMFVEDDSGQIWVKGWRNQARLIDKCQIGEIISITGLNARSGLEGRTELFLTPYSKIIKKN
ncbi:MAG: single-stranded DNA-binding protein [Nitrosopumilaceae archaeon]|nr:single-stranded DNA-binding protein [Nitrosopumilaceae archaeon]NIU00254.1 single-stranded DNA-binding protein [Nitrosopumilaceae archaeon]NIU86666.1 single-stranded DNA-binding protein [Nitrosopumilaceae archaeon]NIV65361.1 single-stranded DNA-binding protein [Nitrosopumilaceae archaeon]NIX60856.1 single-stranded DNA-binding protein [Nitrosopumilaceae archaeon]